MISPPPEKRNRQVSIFKMNTTLRFLSLLHLTKYYFYQGECIQLNSSLTGHERKNSHKNS
jgi:hypothetical protein